LAIIIILLAIMKNGRTLGSRPLLTASCVLSPQGGEGIRSSTPTISAEGLDKVDAVE
jgi:hypothetical protein